MHSAASRARTPNLPKDLKGRLARLHAGGQPVVPQIGSSAERPLTRAWFGLGVVLGSLLGCATLLLMPPARSAPVPQAATAPAVLAATAEPRAAHSDRERPELAAGLPGFELTIRRGYDGEALLPLLVDDADFGEGLLVVLRDLPEAVWLSNGERQDEHTWLLRLGDLDGLHVTLGRNTPDAFDARVELTSQAGALLGSTVARVRLASPGGIAPGARVGFAATPTEPTRPAASPAPPFRTEVVAASPIPAEELQPARNRPIERPEGMSALGGPISEAAAGAPAMEPTGRKLWWKMPTTAWAPFSEAHSPH